MPINYRDYNSGFKALSNFIRFERAKGNCEFCGVKHGMPNPKTGSKVILQTAHLDQDHLNDDHQNLKALCQRCHNRYDAPFRIISRIRNQIAAMRKAGQLYLFQ